MNKISYKGLSYNNLDSLNNNLIKSKTSNGKTVNYNYY